MDEKSPVPVNHGRPSNSNVGDIHNVGTLVWTMKKKNIIDLMCY